MRLKSLAVLAAAALMLPAAPAAAQRGVWQTIGYKTVGRGTDTDTLRVRGDRRHRQIRVCALNRAIEMISLDIRFANGARQDALVRRFINAGTCTRPIDLRGRRRDIREVRMRYARLMRGTLPVVRVQAR